MCLIRYTTLCGKPARCSHTNSFRTQFRFVSFVMFAFVSGKVHIMWQIYCVWSHKFIQSTVLCVRYVVLVYNSQLWVALLLSMWLNSPGNPCQLYPPFYNWLACFWLPFDWNIQLIFQSMPKIICLLHMQIYWCNRQLFIEIFINWLTALWVFCVIWGTSDVACLFWYFEHDYL